jgi:hypothetical protein
MNSSPESVEAKVITEIHVDVQVELVGGLSSDVYFVGQGWPNE